MESNLIERTAEFDHPYKSNRRVQSKVVAANFVDSNSGVPYVGMVLWVREHLSGRPTSVPADHVNATLGDFP